MAKHLQMQHKKYLTDPRMGPFWKLAAREFLHSGVMLLLAYTLALVSLLVMGGPHAAAALMPGWLVGLVAQIVRFLS